MREMTMRYLVIANDKFPPFRVDLTVLFGKEMTVNKGHQIDWLMQADKDSKVSVERWEGGKTYVGGMSRRPGIISKLYKSFSGPINDLKLVWLVRKNQYDFILVKDKFFAAFLAILVNKLIGIPWMYWLSYPFPESFLHEWQERTVQFPYLSLVRGRILSFLLYKVIIPNAGHVFVQSEQMKNDICEYGIPKGKMTPVPMGIDLESVAAFKEFSPKEFEPLIVYTGVFFKVRRLDFIIRSFAILKKRIENAKLIMVGAGKTREDEIFLEREVSRLGLDESVVFTGFVPFSQMLEYVRRAAICVSVYYPSFILNSTSPTKLIEYMAMGKATVANDHPEQSQILDESGAGICVNYDENDFAEAMFFLLNDKELVAKMGKRARQYVESNRSYSIIADMVEEKLKVLLD